MLGVKILVGKERILFYEVLEDVVSDAALPLRRTYASIIKGLSHPFGHWPVHDDSVCRDAADVVALKKGWKDSRGLVARLLFTDAHTLRFGEPHADSWS
jgi:hypothetical protein